MLSGEGLSPPHGQSPSRPRPLDDLLVPTAAGATIFDGLPIRWSYIIALKYRAFIFHVASVLRPGQAWATRRSAFHGTACDRSEQQTSVPLGVCCRNASDETFSPLDKPAASTRLS